LSLVSIERRASYQWELKKRRSAAAAAASLCVLVGVAGVAAAVGLVRIPPNGVALHVSSERRTAQSFRFTAAGKVDVPKVICPPQPTSSDYCVQPQSACTGTVRVEFKLGYNPYLSDYGAVALVLAARVHDDCSYSATGSIPRADLTATTHVNPGAPGHFDEIAVTGHYGGSAVLLPADTPKRQVAVQIINIA
jgi:hypothetical protein